MNGEAPSQVAVVAAERRRIILDWIVRHGSVKVACLTDALEVGANTIRADLDALEREGKLMRVHGGAILKDRGTPRPPYSQTRGANLEEKSGIGAAALEFVPENGTIFIGSGSTTYQLAIRLTPEHRIHVVTNALDVAAYLASNQIATVDFLGGNIRPDSLESDLTLSEHSLESLYWDVAFMGAAAIDAARGITTFDRDTARCEKIVIGRAGKVVALCDSTKIGSFAYAQVGPASLIDVLVTDSGINSEMIEELSGQGIRVAVAKKPEEVI